VGSEWGACGCRERVGVRGREGVMSEWEESVERGLGSRVKGLGVMRGVTCSSRTVREGFWRCRFGCRCCLLLAVGASSSAEGCRRLTASAEGGGEAARFCQRRASALRALRDGDCPRGGISAGARAFGRRRGHTRCPSARGGGRGVVGPAGIFHRSGLPQQWDSRPPVHLLARRGRTEG